MKTRRQFDYEINHIKDELMTLVSELFDAYELKIAEKIERLTGELEGIQNTEKFWMESKT